MEIKKIINGNKATVRLEGRIDAKTSPEIEEELLKLPDEVKALDLDFHDVAYISSAGLRMVIKVQTHYEQKNGSVRILGPIDEILEIFEITGLSEFLNIG
ncbi:MAG: STAS domain-containing protein [Ruminococcus sp.]|nr:STAS domain-containing protein [Ruminococcus sp.]